MADAIFLVRGDGTLAELRPTSYESESVLQQLLANHPDLLAGGATDDEGRRWLLIGQEIGVPKREDGGAHWSLDHLFLDQDAVPTVVEVKRSSDTRIRREVVGQMMDYAANGVRYWPVDHLRATFEAKCARDGVDPDVALAELTGPGTDSDEFWSRFGDNLRSGNMRLVFVADRIPAELTRIIEFLNEQMRRVEVLGIEVQQYVGEGVQTLVPRVVGRTARADQTKDRRPRMSYGEILAGASDSAREVERRLLEWADHEGRFTTLSKAARQFRTAAGGWLQIYPRDAQVQFSLVSVREALEPRQAEALTNQLEEIAGRKIGKDYPLVGCAQLLGRWQEFAEAWLPRYIEACEAGSDS